jgi:hypothetical protein
LHWASHWLLITIIFIIAIDYYIIIIIFILTILAIDITFH